MKMDSYWISRYHSRCRIDESFIYVSANMLCLFVFKKLHSKSLSGSEKITWIQDKKRASLPRITGILTLRSQEPTAWLGLCSDATCLCLWVKGEIASLLWALSSTNYSHLSLQSVFLNREYKDWKTGWRMNNSKRRPCPHWGKLILRRVLPDDTCLSFHLEYYVKFCYIISYYLGQFFFAFYGVLLIYLWFKLM